MRTTLKTDLDRLLDGVDPHFTLDQVSVRVDEAVNSFPMESGIIYRWDKFRTVLMEFHWHVIRNVLRTELTRSPNPEIEWGRCCEILLKEYDFNGDKAAFEMARTGAEGGLYKILRAIARQMIEKYAGNEISARISNFWHPLSDDEKFAVIEEYLKKYGHLLPPELTEGSAARIKGDFKKVLAEHPRMIRELRKIGRS